MADETKEKEDQKEEKKQEIVKIDYDQFLDLKKNHCYF